MSLINSPKGDAHPEEDLWEEYCLGRVQEPTLAQLEEHLLVCEACQETLRNLDEYITAFKAAVAGEGLLASGQSVQPRLENTIQQPNSRPAAISSEGSNWASILRAPYLPRLAGIGVALGLLALTSSSVARRPTEEETVYLTGYRGGSNRAAEAQAHRRHPLQLKVEYAARVAQAYRFEIVDEIGRPLWSGDAEATTDSPAAYPQDSRMPVTASHVSAHIKGGLPAGHYWVRLLANPATSSEAPLGEFGLNVIE